MLIEKQYMILFKGAVLMMRCMPMYEIFNAEHAFVYYIVDKLSKTVVFSGRFNNLPK